MLYTCDNQLFFLKGKFIFGDKVNSLRSNGFNLLRLNLLLVSSDALEEKIKILVWKIGNTSHTQLPVSDFHWL